MSSELLTNTHPHGEEYDIVQFGRPLWTSFWVASKEDNHSKFSDVIKLAKHKLLGGNSKWENVITDSQWKRTAVLALVACVAVLYVSPASSITPEFVRAHLGILIAIDKDHENYIITYPSEPVLSEASLQLMSEGDVLREILQKLDLTFRSGDILDADSQGELAVRLLSLNAWSCLVLSKC